MSFTRPPTVLLPQHRRIRAPLLEVSFAACRFSRTSSLGTFLPVSCFTPSSPDCDEPTLHPGPASRSNRPPQTGARARRTRSLVQARDLDAVEHESWRAPNACCWRFCTDGHTPRPLDEKATAYSCRHEGQRTRKNPYARIPQRRNPRSSLTTKLGRLRPSAWACSRKVSRCSWST